MLWNKLWFSGRSNNVDDPPVNFPDLQDVISDGDLTGDITSYA